MKATDLFEDNVAEFSAAIKDECQNEIFDSLLNSNIEKRIIFIFNSDFIKNKELIDSIKDKFNFKGYCCFDDPEEYDSCVDGIKAFRKNFTEFLKSSDQYIVLSPIYLYLLFYILDSVDFNNVSGLKNKLKIFFIYELNSFNIFSSFSLCVANEINYRPDVILNDLNMNFIQSNSQIDTLINSKNILNLSLFDFLYIIKYNNLKDIELNIENIYEDDFSHFMNEGIFLIKNDHNELNDKIKTKQDFYNLTSQLSKIKNTNSALTAELVKSSGVITLEDVLKF